MSHHISVTIITRNEGDRIEACLKSVAQVADEIIVVDSFSTDFTADICRRYGCRVVSRSFEGFGQQRQFATSLTSHSYVLSIDADEALSPALVASILKEKEAGFPHRVYAMARLNFFCGEPVRHCGWYPDYQVRLFDKRYANWNMHSVDERVVFPPGLQPCRLDGDIFHYRCSTKAQYARIRLRQAALASKHIAVEHSHISLITPFLRGAYAYLKMYIGSQAIMDGAEGRAISNITFKSTYTAWNLARKSHNS
ncbi:MAG: glycosyltransferase family 2 protein [Muribaculum sp.]|nr:glycosyltransferase family 2 protein [Muribaculaceae bacterium]MCM1081237.1 glycosyltransferase family 2 protein [Muribaculum sp.]